jgi:hypothetical protein
MQAPLKNCIGQSAVQLEQSHPDQGVWLNPPARAAKSGKYGRDKITSNMNLSSFVYVENP